MEATSVAEARKILGQHFLGTEKVEEHFGVQFSGERFDLFAEVPISRTVLKERRETHILFPGCSLRIPEIRERVLRELFYSSILANGSHTGEFTQERVRPCWHLMRKEVVHDSLRRTNRELHAMLGKNEMVPRACETASMIILYYLVTGIRLFTHTYARSWCTSIPVDVGFFGFLGLGIQRRQDCRARSRVGIAPVYYHSQYEPLSVSRW